ncbi:FUSC family protein [Actinomadura sp. DC4]|uniref:FUSC family protein n=1 Tax=Actinomadura sp. DC4 TaxID=3055069 RepID=UPI0025B0F015|nr:FUSC family protein [Actinomadura sp. DC4]MDN3351635.1 aromatic acid exporter family protein [Actinomadura sp. DC4]
MSAITEPLKVVRRKAQSKAALVARLTTTATASYLIALLVPGTTARPTLAPLTALLVLQFSLYRTLRSAVQRVGSVAGGVLVAVVLAWALGFTWWSLGLAVGAALVLGHLLRLGEHVLEAPISAMLILSLPTGMNAADRVLETLIGAAAGLAAGLVFSPLRVQPAEEAIEELGRDLGGLLDTMAEGLRRTPTHEETVDWLSRARTLGKELGRVDRALSDAEDSIRLNPRATGLPHASVALRTGLEALEHVWMTLRGLARSVADSTRGPEDPAFGRAAQDELARTLEDLAASLRMYGRMLGAEVGGDTGPAESELRKSLTCAEAHRDRVAETLLNLPADEPPGWPLRGELLVHLDRLLDQLRVEHRATARETWPSRRPSRRRAGPPRPSRIRPRHPARREPPHGRRARERARSRGRGTR